MKFLVPLKFIYSERATTFCDISTGDLSYVAKVKSTVEILKDFVAFSEFMNFNILSIRRLGSARKKGITRKM